MPDQTKYTNKLKDARVLVIGGTSGIGFCVAEAAVEHGAEIIVSSSNPNRVEDAISRLQTAYPSARARISGHACNLGVEDALGRNLKALLDACGGKLHHIVYTAGDAFGQLALPDITIKGIKDTGIVRFFAPMVLAKHAPNYMHPGSQSSLTLTSGTVGQRPLPDRSVIGSFAAGLQGMARSLAFDMKPIRVNLVSPGAVRTELWANSMPAEHIEGMLKMMGEKTTTGKVGLPEEVAEAYLYLMRDANCTGEMISTNGGALLL